MIDFKGDIPAPVAINRENPRKFSLNKNLPFGPRKFMESPSCKAFSQLLPRPFSKSFMQRVKFLEFFAGAEAMEYPLMHGDFGSSSTFTLINWPA